MSGACEPPITSNGCSCTTAGSSFDWSGTTFVVSVSTTWQVSVSVNGSPERTAEAELRHQHVIGSTSTSTVPDGGACPCTWAAPSIAITTSAVGRRRAWMSSKFIVQRSQLENHPAPVHPCTRAPCYFFFLNRRSWTHSSSAMSNLRLVRAQPQHVEAAILRLRRHVVLPGCDARLQPTRLAARHQARAARFRRRTPPPSRPTRAGARRQTPRRPARRTRRARCWPSPVRAAPPRDRRTGSRRRPGRARSCARTRRAWR